MRLRFIKKVDPYFSSDSAAVPAGHASKRLTRNYTPVRALFRRRLAEDFRTKDRRSPTHFTGRFVFLHTTGNDLCILRPRSPPPRFHRLERSHHAYVHLAGPDGGAGGLRLRYAATSMFRLLS